MQIMCFMGIKNPIKLLEKLIYSFSIFTNIPLSLRTCIYHLLQHTLPYTTHNLQVIFLTKLNQLKH